jgi:hypothetical protein
MLVVESGKVRMLSWNKEKLLSQLCNILFNIQVVKILLVIQIYNLILLYNKTDLFVELLYQVDLAWLNKQNQEKFQPPLHFF